MVKYRSGSYQRVICFLGIFLCLYGLTRGNHFSDREYSLHVKRLKRRIGEEKFTILIQKPFVVISDEEPETVKYISERIVAWAVKKLKYMYFNKDPENIIDIWLFNGEDSYRKYTWRFFRHKPDTPFGYSSPELNALIMNIRTGGGTLVHEIVHPFMRANFPRCPAWFNEGLASLYEESTGKGKMIIGLINWRLPRLQKAISKKFLPALSWLLSTSEYIFYEKDPVTNYAMARYLCYYLQENGLLMKFFHEFRKNHKKDPSGSRTLKRVLNENSMTAFQKKWENFIMNLKRTE